MRRVRFSLRALLITLAVVSVWLGWNASIVRQRSRLLRQLEGQHTTVVYWTEMDEWTDSGGAYKFAPEAEDLLSRDPPELGQLILGRKSKKPTFLRRLLGDRSVFIISVETDENVRALQEAFPESKIHIEPE